MSEQKLRWIFYIEGVTWLLPLFIAVFAIDNFIGEFLNFLLGFLWIYAIDTPGTKSRVLKHRYKFSFLRIIFKLDQIIRVKIARAVSNSVLIEFIRALVPCAFVLILNVIGGSMFPAFTVFGAAYYVLFKFVRAQFLSRFH